jgi:hypothetical protein
MVMMEMAVADGNDGEDDGSNDRDSGGGISEGMLVRK